ncbi:MAG: CYTH and CHAD domain-containing protein [Kineosporiaceae bacterium]|nr:CYTH and CHAD domain-containing protein [Kineosporiaceae bacterium]
MAKKAKRASKGKNDHVVEIEQKFDVPVDFTLPDLADLPGVARVDEPVTYQLEATYLDTADLDLLTHKWILRRRTGGSDAGWHLKRPLAEGERDEMHFPLGRSARTIPVAVQRAVAVHTRGKPLAPIARLSTERTVRALRDARGAVLAEVMLDAVDAASLHPDGSVRDASTWFEMETELGTGDLVLLRALDERMRSAGAWPSPSVSKLAQAMQERLAVEPLNRVAPPPQFGPATAVGVVLAYLAGEVCHLQENDPLVRVDAEDAVHQMRVASRRLRSALATFRPLFDRSVTDPIRVELQWIGAELGSARDVEVIRDHLVQAVTAEPAALQHGPVVKRIRSTMAARYKQAHTHGVAQLSSERYYALLDSLDALVATPPLAEDAGGREVEYLLKLVRRTWKRIEDLHDQLELTDDRHERDVHLHEVRKAAKRARYAGEALAPTFGKSASDYASAMSSIQSSLGDHQDSVVIREELVALAEAALAAGEPTFTYGRLHALEQVRGAETEEAFAAAWSKASARSVLRWMKA